MVLFVFVSSGILAYHQINSRGEINTKEFFAGTGHFSSGGSLWFGKWYISRTNIKGVPVKPFKGNIDNVRIWSTKLNAVQIKHSIQRIGRTTSNGLVSHWLFDEGEGQIINNEIPGGSQISLPDVSSRRPTWQFSYATESPPSAQAHLHDSSEVKSNAEKLCRHNIYNPKLMPVFQQYLSQAQLLFYYKACLDTVYSTGSNSASYKIGTALTDELQKRLDLKNHQRNSCATKFLIQHGLDQIVISSVSLAKRMLRTLVFVYVSMDTGEITVRTNVLVES